MENSLEAVRLLATTVIRSEVGKLRLDKLFQARAEFNKPFVKNDQQYKHGNCQKVICHSEFGRRYCKHQYYHSQRKGGSSVDFLFNYGREHKGSYRNN